MSSVLKVPWDRILCRQIIDRLRDGEPPPIEALEFLSVGQEDHLARTKIGLDKAAAGGYDVLLLEGKYGIGKSHLLGRVEVLARARNFKVRHLEIGSGVYFNNPDLIYRLVKNADPEPSYRYYWRGDRLRKFVGELKALTDMYVSNGMSGLVLLLDEVENTFYLNRFPSRAKSYRFLGALFHGRDNGGYGYVLELSNMLVVIALTPGTIEQAKSDGWWTWTSNPARSWVLPERRTVEPLSSRQAMELIQRVRTIHSVAFDWDASEFVPDAELEKLSQDWYRAGDSRDERQLLKKVIRVLELAEQNR